MPIELPKKCMLCNVENTVKSANFMQKYRQYKSEPVNVLWWECMSCGGWFASPQPSEVVIANNWKLVSYQNKSKHNDILQAKISVHNRILSGIDTIRDGKKGRLLDVGCNYGDFLRIAKDLDWTPSGFDANKVAVDECQKLGFDTRLAWGVHDAGFNASSFAAVVVNDVFCYSRHPYEELRGYADLLESGGVLAMRITNKHFAMRIVRSMPISIKTKESYLSNILLDQFHSVSVGRLGDIMGDLGFCNASIIINAAPTVTWKNSTWKTRLSYGISHILYSISLGKINIIPGILIFAKKL